MLFQRKTISNKSLLLFTHHLSTLVHAGMPLLRSLLILEQQTIDALLKKTITELITSLQGGISFSNALAVHPKIFSHFYCSMVKAGELGGILGKALQQIATLQERKQKTNRKIVSILIYPIIVLLMTFFIIGFLFIFIVPQFETVFSEMLHGKALPVMTKVVLEMSRYLTHHAFSITLLLVTLCSTMVLWFKTKLGIRCRERLLLGIPLVGILLQKEALALFARTLGTLMKHGVPILQALQVTQETAVYHRINQGIKTIHDSVQLGNSITASMKQQSLFPPMFVSMIDVGEETAQLPEMLLKAATIYDDEFYVSVEQLLSLLEPIMILLLALLVGSIVIALFLPLVSMIGEMGN